MSEKLFSSLQTVYYWNEPLKIKGTPWELFTAVCEDGLVMSGLGEKEKYINKLARLINNHLPEYKTVEDREANLQVIQEFKEYFEGHRKNFSFRLNPLGTEFQRKVWQELLNIPYGETCSYSEIAEKIKCPKGQRAVGLANNKNPLALVVPCHRVIGKKGDLTGYAGGLHIKKMLLELEEQGTSEEVHG